MPCTVWCVGPRWVDEPVRHFMKTYTYSNGLTITPRMQPCGAFVAMGETQIEEEKVFDVHQRGKLLETAETWDQAKGMVFDILSNVQEHTPAPESAGKKTLKGN